MRGFRWVVGFAVVLGFAGCSPEQDASTIKVMPNVEGLTLDVALRDLKSVGVGDDVEVLGGGAFGIVDESNWLVCSQSPGAGEALTTAPSLTVERSCGGDSDPAASEPSQEAPSQKPGASDPAETSPGEVLTVGNNADLAALLTGPGECESVAQFAAEYRGRALQFDGNIAAMSDYGRSDAPFFERYAIDDVGRHDMLIYAGDYSETSISGPSFRFTDVAVLDLALTGATLPSSVGAGDNLRFVATVGEFTTGCLLLLEPVSTEVR